MKKHIKLENIMYDYIVGHPGLDRLEQEFLNFFSFYAIDHEEVFNCYDDLIHAKLIKETDKEYITAVLPGIIFKSEPFIVVSKVIVYPTTQGMWLKFLLEKGIEPKAGNPETKEFIKTRMIND